MKRKYRGSLTIIPLRQKLEEIKKIEDYDLFVESISDLEDKVRESNFDSLLSD